MDRRSHFQQLLNQGDVRGLCAAWAQLYPGMPQPETDEQAEIAMHAARTQAESVTFRNRAYSHAWLRERSLPSQLPDILRPKAEQMHPVAVGAVGISVNTGNPFLAPVVVEVRKAMEHAVEDAYANGDTDPVLVSALMQDAQRKTYRKLLG